MTKRTSTNLRDFIDAAEKQRLKDSIIEVKKPYLETERVLVAEGDKGPDLIREIIRHVQNCQQEFVSPDHPDLAPQLPLEESFNYMTPIEITAPRERFYYLDREGVLRELKTEIRQEQKNGFVKQTTKEGNGATPEDSTMDRMEQASKLKGFGFNVFAVGDSNLRGRLLDSLQSVPKRVQRMISQRVRIPYHPDGNPNIVIEMALEPLHVGQTFTGFVWRRPKIDLEIKLGPKNKMDRHALLAHEENRLLGKFDLTKQLKSSPTPGFNAIQTALEEDPGVREQFDALDDNTKWWKDSAKLVPIAA